MLTIKNRPKLKTKLISFILRYISRLENKNNGNFFTNGEHFLMKGLLEYYSKASNIDPLIIFDVGANIGKYTDEASKLAHQQKIAFKIHCFEPLKVNYEVLKSKFNEEQHVKINCFGLSNKKVSANIYFRDDNYEIASLYNRNLEMYHSKLTNSEVIALETGSEYMTNNNVGKVNLLKVDVEGHELFALKGFEDKIQNVDFVQFEYGNCNIDSNTRLSEIYDFLSNNGFKIGKIMPKHIEIQDYSKQMEDYTYSNFLAINTKLLKSLNYND